MRAAGEFAPERQGAGWLGMTVALTQVWEHRSPLGAKVYG